MNGGKSHKHVNQQEEEDELEQPPVLEPETGAVGGGSGTTVTYEETLIGAEGQRSFALDSIDPSYIVEDGYYVDDGVLYQKSSIPRRSATNKYFDDIKPFGGAAAAGPSSSLGDSNICCGLCGEIVPYELLVTDHLPAFHPEVLKDGIVDLEEIPYETWLSERMAQNNDGYYADAEMKMRMPSLYQQTMPMQPLKSTRQLRRISQYRVNTLAMDLPELELALQKKMVEKIGRKVPVTLVDKLHAKCGLCDTVISLNKKFEIVHLVRHFNAWHPSSHKCAGTWPDKEFPTPMGGKPLSAQDFAVIDTDLGAIENLQCVWCGMFLTNRALGMHFHEVHPEEVEVPKCNLCMQELLTNARLTEKYGEDFGVTLPDEHTYRSIRFKRDFKSEVALEKAIVKYLQRINDGEDPSQVDVEDMDVDSEEEAQQELGSCEAFSNSRMRCGRKARPKRQFMMPIVRQAAPRDSQFVSAITHSHWKCKLCRADIYAAVISAGVIKHYKKFHSNFLANVQFELCKARLEKMSNGMMELVGDEMVECSLCAQSFPVTPPFNISRAVRHLKIKHPEVMPEHRGGGCVRDGFPTPGDHKYIAERDYDQQQHQLQKEQRAGMQEQQQQMQNMEEGVIYATEENNYQVLDMLRQNYSVTFDRVFSVYGRDIQQRIYILCNEGDELDAEMVEQIAKVKDPSQDPMVVQINKQTSSDQTEEANLAGMF